MIPCSYQHLSLNFHPLILTKWQNKYGFINNNNDVIIPNQYEHAFPFSENKACVRLRGKYGYIDSKGKKLIEFQFEDAMPFSEGIAGAKVNGKWGFINSSGKWVIAPWYEEISGFYPGTAIVKVNNKAGAINKKGEFILPPVYHSLSFFNCNFFRASIIGRDTVRNKKETYMGMIDKQNKVIIPFEYLSFWMSKDAMGALIPGYITQKTTVPFFVTNKDYEYELVDLKKGTIAGPFSEIGYAGSGFYAVKTGSEYKGNNWTLLDSMGSTVFDSLYQKFGIVNEGLIPIKKNGLWGYADMKNEVVIDFLFSEASSFRNGKALVIKEGVLELIDSKGTKIASAIPFDATISAESPVFTEKFIVLKKEAHYGAVDYNGNTVFPAVYENRIDFSIWANYYE